MINDNTKPLILIGSNSALFFLQELCEQHNIDLAGIIDSDYYGNTDQLEGIPVIDSETSFDNPDKLEYYKNNYNFFLATNWTSGTSATHQRNFKKRKQLIEIIETKQLPCISLVDNSARVHKSNVIGKNVLIDALVYISPKNIIGDYTSFYASTMIGYHNVIGNSAVFQRHAGIMHYNNVGDDVYIGLHSQICGDNLNISSGTVVHPCMAIKRSTTENELISLAGRDLRKVYPYFSIVE
jgi:serine acetyltransferase